MIVSPLIFADDFNSERIRRRRENYRRFKTEQPPQCPWCACPAHWTHGLPHKELYFTITRCSCYGNQKGWRFPAQIYWNRVLLPRSGRLRGHITDKAEIPFFLGFTGGWYHCSARFKCSRRYDICRTTIKLARYFPRCNGFLFYPAGVGYGRTGSSTPQKLCDGVHQLIKQHQHGDQHHQKQRRHPRPRPHVIPGLVITGPHDQGVDLMSRQHEGIGGGQRHQ
jgi:hypothetical protein